MATPEDFFALLADETRLRCLILLSKKEEICVCEFGGILKAGQPKISRHLAHLRKGGLVVDERRGQWVYYRLHPELDTWKRNVLKTVSLAYASKEPYQSDILGLDPQKSCGS